MVGVTPVGIITNCPNESRKFYKEVMGVDRVQFLKKIVSEDVETENFLLRLESPQLEILSIETRLLDRAVNRVVRKDYSLHFHPKDLKELLRNLNKEKIETRIDDKGNLSFEDLNGIHWEIRTR